MYEGRATKDPDLRDKRWAMSGFATFAFDGLDHRGFFTADVGPCPAPQINVARLDDPGFLQRTDLTAQDLQNRRIFVPHIDERFFCLDRPRGNQHAFEKQMRSTFKVIAILKCTRLTLITIDGKVTRPLIGAHEAPLPT